MPDDMKQLSFLDQIEIPLTQGYVALVDPCDADLLDYKWQSQYSRGLIYAVRSIRVGARSDNKTEKVSMHRIVLARKLKMKYSLDGLKTDHIDGNSLNNCRSNLRLATYAENNRNTRVRRDNTSGYKGVSWAADRGKWVAVICVDKCQRWLGAFDDPAEAAIAYNEAALRYHGEFARLNEVAS